MSLQTPSMTGAAGDCCVEGEGELLTVPKPRAVSCSPCTSRSESRMPEIGSSGL
jgi:hypothetical protein